MDVTEVLLPGVGLRYEFVLEEGQRLGVVARRNGEFEFVAYDRADPDRSRNLFRLTPDEADAITEILGAPRIAERFADLTREIPGLHAGQVQLPAGSVYAGRTLGDTKARTRTGASIVAIVRGDTVIASPGPSQLLQTGDVLVVIGTERGITGVENILAG